MIGQTDGIAVRVNLPLALEHIGILGLAGVVRVPEITGGSLVERIGVGVNVNERELLPDYACQHLAQMLVFLAKVHVRPYLRAGIPEPHSVDVPCVHKSEAGGFIVMDGGVQRVGEAVHKHPAQLGILQLRRHLGNLGLYGLGNEEAVLLCGTLVGVFLRTGAQARAQQQRGNRDT